MTWCNECLEMGQIREDHINNWRERYPNHCPLCMGEGQTHWKMGSPPELLEDGCQCIVDGECPRCGEELILRGGLIDDAYCISCFWCDDHKDRCPPELEECYCNYEEDIDQYE